MSNKVRSAIALTGGTAGCLDKIDGAQLQDKDVAIVFIQDGNVLPYVLDEDSGEAENSPLIISPDTNAGNKRWKLIGLQGAFSHVIAKETAGATISTATLTLVKFNSESKDTLSEYNISTGIFTATYDGVYLVNANINFAVATWSASNKEASIRLYVEAADVHRGIYFYSQVASSFRSSVLVSTEIELLAGEDLDLRVYQNSGSTLTIADGYLTIGRIA